MNTERSPSFYHGIKTMRRPPLILDVRIDQMGQVMRKCVLSNMQTTKVQISLRIRWFESSVLKNPRNIFA